MLTKRKLWRSSNRRAVREKVPVAEMIVLDANILIGCTIKFRDQTPSSSVRYPGVEVGSEFLETGRHFVTYRAALPMCGFGNGHQPARAGAGGRIQGRRILNGQ